MRLLGLLESGGNPKQRKDMYGNKWRRPSSNNGTQMVDKDDDEDMMMKLIVGYSCARSNTKIVREIMN
ncbi:hypothetical protein M8J75_000136 [Diaphorina citri]|nr:hypothetical protein M8J75_000136 [Diaphorina citri]